MGSWIRDRGGTCFGGSLAQFLLDLKDRGGDRARDRAFGSAWALERGGGGDPVELIDLAWCDHHHHHHHTTSLMKSSTLVVLFVHAWRLCSMRC